MTNSYTRRAAAAAALAVGLLVEFAALGGVSAGQSAISADQYQYGKKVTICHKGKTITISRNAWPAHQRHGDVMGTCAAAKAKKAKAAKAKAAAKAAAAKAKAEAAKAAAEDKKAEKKPEHAGNPGNPGKGKGGKG